MRKFISLKWVLCVSVVCGRRKANAFKLEIPQKFFCVYRAQYFRNKSERISKICAQLIWLPDDGIEWAMLQCFLLISQQFSILCFKTFVQWQSRWEVWRFIFCRVFYCCSLSYLTLINKLLIRKLQKFKKAIKVNLKQRTRRRRWRRRRENVD